MSDYRDDSTDVLIASDSTWMGLTTIVESTARITATAIFGLLVTHSDMLTASDEVIDRWNHASADTLAVSDAFLDHKHAAPLTSERRRITDTVIDRLRVRTDDTLTISDAVIDNTRSVTAEHLHIADTVLPQRTVATLVTERATVGDASGQFTSQLVEESAGAADQVLDRAHAKVLITETGTLSDDVLDMHAAPAAGTEDRLHVTAAVFDQLHAIELVEELALLDDDTPGSTIAGQAWTAPVDGWAMSRYSPYHFESLAVINGALFGIAADGVYALGEVDTDVNGLLRTGRLDMSGEVLVHPVAAYLEYELGAAGVASMDVTTTQGGAAPATYAYPLPTKSAEVMTSGRFTFGRGLRGRYFAYALHLTAPRGLINDLSVTVAPTKRRV